MHANHTPSAPTEWETLVQQHLPLADRLAHQYAHRGVDLEDLTQVARLGLLLAARRFRPHTCTPFEAFAIPTIQGELKRHFRDHGWVVRPPRRIQELRARARVARAELEQRCAHPPTATELARVLAVPPAEVEECAAADSSFSPRSLDVPDDDGVVPLRDRLAAEGSEPDAVVDLLTLRRELRRLSARDRQILAWRYEQLLTQHEIGNRLGVSQMQVSRILAGIHQRLRTAFDHELATVS